jgi:hypothetical protein
VLNKKIRTEKIKIFKPRTLTLTTTRDIKLYLYSILFKILAMDRFGAAAVFNNLFLQPLDVIKTRQILSADNIRTADLAKNIWNNEG